MAIGVSTWNEFVQAYKGTETEIEILADLNCNDNPLSEPLKAGSDKTINGNGHNINRLGTQTTIGGPMFSYLGTDNSSFTINWNKVNFLQVFSSEAQYIFYGGYSSGGYVPHYYRYMYFKDCIIQGKGPQLCTFVDMQRCSVTWDGGDLYHAAFTNCWIHIDQYRPSNSNGYVIYSSIDSCYLEGEITAAQGVTDSGRIVDGYANSCFNIKIPEGTRWTNISTGGDYQRLSVINMDRFKGTFTNESFYYAVGVTDSQMHNAAYLASVGFDIVS